MYKELTIALLAIISMIVVVYVIKNTRYEKTFLIIMLIVYAIAVIYLTMFRGARRGLGRFSFRFPPPFIKALIFYHYGTTTNRSMLNLLLFVPFGCLIPSAIQAFTYKVTKTGVNIGQRISLNATLSIGFLASMLIEFSQLFLGVGVFEVDDLLKNTMGAGVGYLIFWILERKKR